ncbi:hypothetical protein EVAR_52007_1 [Eumeta japonica]|uniref:Uncharacterized protein n=1 Tax=Eumeta variegata TaxID=151549 RepID=A0A4C1Y119_EUMVA|nr:hypothetical protein EVAR_52007_1 [Eumeta japonica]
MKAYVVTLQLSSVLTNATDRYIDVVGAQPMGDSLASPPGRVSNVKRPASLYVGGRAHRTNLREWVKLSLGVKLHFQLLAACKNPGQFPAIRGCQNLLQKERRLTSLLVGTLDDSCRLQMVPLSRTLTFAENFAHPVQEAVPKWIPK